MSKLFAFYLGGKAKDAHLEVHDVVFAIGESVEDCYPQITQQWFGLKQGLHIDAIMEIPGADGYQVKIGNNAIGSDAGDKVNKDLYLVNLGGSIDNEFYEFHKLGLVVAGSQMGAMSRAKSKILVNFVDRHVDNVLDVEHHCKKVSDMIPNVAILLVPDISFNGYNPPVTTCYKAVK